MQAQATPSKNFSQSGFALRQRNIIIAEPNLLPGTAERDASSFHRRGCCGIQLEPHPVVTN
ncbi:hypothetical protein CUJ84_Chr005033 [Rhizobium leguminosarum]|uniref:Uncharacterized protein n=1 Tax=Rhizobium leguminosarum TaxID=384 RepID=A0A2K9ZAP3_RHILE|nr:hypothetical protein CUJ84_Chr005033 [Rhizobium leguminosarum]